MKRLVFVTGLLLTALLQPRNTLAGGVEQSGATFVVHCYDVGADHLEGKPGVVSVKRGWLGFHEVDRVVYDPQTVSREQLESWLKDVGTYVRTVEEPDSAYRGMKR